MPIVPDTKNWTWVLERPCPECGFDSSTLAAADVAGLIRSNAALWQEVLQRSERELTVRPSDDRWSALEYACHVRDVFGLYEERLRLMLDQEDPTFSDWDQDAAAVEQRYNDQDPADVARDLADGAAVLADSFDGVDGAQWQRAGTRSDGSHFTVDSFARYLIHDPIHHIWDVEQGFAELAERSP